MFNVERHALDCQAGGLIGQWYNESHDAIGNLASLAWGQDQKEPVICEEVADCCDDTLVGDLRVRGAWQPPVDAVFDVLMVDTFL